MQISFYVEYDEPPEFGGRQCIFPVQGDDLDQLVTIDTNWNKNGPFNGGSCALLGSKIISITLQEDRTLKFTVEI